MKEKRIEKEIKKAQKKGIYNPKLKLGIVALILVIGTVIGVSYAYYTSNPNTVLNIKGTVSKRIRVSVYAGEHGKVNELDLATEQADYGTSTQSFKLTPDPGYQYKDIRCTETYNSSTDVTNKVASSYNKSNNTLTLTPRTINDVTCTVEFERVRTLQEIKDDIIKTVKNTSPTFSAGCPTSSGDNCSGVYKMADYSNSTSLNYNNPGGTSYYFRGEAKNNYVKFGTGTIKNGTAKQDLIWRIVRINGDGSIRLVLDSDIGTRAFNSAWDQRKYAGYTYDNTTPCTNASPCKYEYNNGTFSSNNTGTNSTIKSKLETWYQDNLKEYDQYIDYGIYCNDTSYGSGSEDEELYYSPYERLQKSPYQPQLTCPDPTAGTGVTSDYTNVNGTNLRTYGGVYKLKIGLLSADEIVLAGFKPTNSNGVTDTNYLYYTGSSNDYFWSSSPHGSRSNSSNARGFRGRLNYRSLDYSYVTNAYGVRPVINLKTDNLKATGEGTKDEPFEVIIN